MPNYFVPSLKTKTAKEGDGVKLEKGNAENLRSSDDVESESLPKPGNISRPAKIFKLGEKGSGTRPLGALQDYNVLYKKYWEAGELFEDPEFPAIQSSIYGSDQTETNIKNVKWLRPREILEEQKIQKEPQLFVEKASRFDVKEGSFGDGWFLAALANLAMDETLLTQVVPKDQKSFDEDKYAGIFHFRFWQYEKWVDVVIDDRLPTDDSDQLLGASSATKNEFWSALLEKAYAKLHGSYTAIEGGFPGEAMEDLTGGVAEHYSHPFPDDLFDVILRAHEKNALLSCGFEKIEDEAKMKGLHYGHAYSITKVKLLSKGTENEEEIRLVRVRNPWGLKKEWLGAWSDAWPGWQSISEKTKIELEFKSAHDGEFWMSFGDFERHVRFIDICYLNFILKNPGEKEWETSVLEGEWVSGATAGGCNINMERFQHNPQYQMTLEEECTVIVELMQQNRRIQGKKFSAIGLKMIHPKEDPSTKTPKPLDNDYFKGDSFEWEWGTESIGYSNIRQVSRQGKLPPGSHYIIPSTYETDEDGEFILRVISEKPHKIEEYHQPLGVYEVDYSKTDKTQDEKWRDTFWKISGDDWQLDWSELNDKLNDTIITSGLKRPWSHCISEDACRRMVALLDVDRSGKLIYGEVQKFFLDMEKFVSAFRKTWQTIDGDEYLKNLRSALYKAGVYVNIHILDRLVRRYGTKDKKITLENYIICVLRIKNMLSTFKERDPFKTNEAEFTLDEWMDNTLYLL